MPSLPYGPDSPAGGKPGLGKRSKVVTYTALAAIALILVFVVLPSQEENIQHISSNIPAKYKPSRFFKEQSRVHDNVDIHPVYTGQSITPLHETIDYFEHFKKAPDCSPTSQQIHVDFEPKCQTKEDVLRAMSGGGRHGFDKPYATLDCDMRWFTTDEVCAILSKFDRIHFLGDSLIRQILLAMHIYMREDLVEGGRNSWRTDNPDDQDCRCRTLFNKGSKCFWWEAIETGALWRECPEVMKCPKSSAHLQLNLLQALEMVPDHLDDFIKGVEMHLDSSTSKGRNVYIFGAGSWNQYRTPDTIEWIRLVEEGLRERVPSFFDSPRLWISPGSQAENKDPRYVDSGNNIRVQKHVHAMDPHVRALGYDHLAVYNLTVQATSPDGTHTTLESTMMEAMMVLNWLYYM